MEEARVKALVRFEKTSTVFSLELGAKSRVTQERASRSGDLHLHVNELCSGSWTPALRLSLVFWAPGEMYP